MDPRELDPISWEETVDNFYADAIIGLRSEIVSQFGSVLKFVETFPEERFGYENLSRNMGENASQDLSVGLFLRLCSKLYPDAFFIAFKKQYGVKMSVRDYILLKNDPILIALITFALKS